MSTPQLPTSLVRLAGCAIALALICAGAHGAAPVISNPLITFITPTSATTYWNTDIPADSRVDYGTSLSYGLTVYKANLTMTDHTLVLANLTPSTLYHYRLTSTAGGLSSSVSGTFTTASGAGRATGTDANLIRNILAGPSPVTIPARTYNCDGSWVIVDSKTVNATGAVFVDCRFKFQGNQTHWTGGKIIQKDDSSPSPMTWVVSSNSTIRGLSMDFLYAYTGYEIGGSLTNTLIADFTLWQHMNSGITIKSGDGITLDNFSLIGESTGLVDDGVAISIINYPATNDNGITNNITLSNGRATHTYDLLKIQGGNSGMPGTLSNVRMINCVTDKVHAPIFVWGFKNQAVIFDTITVDGLTINDAQGSRYNGAYILLEGAQILRNMTVNNVRYSGRANATAPWYNQHFYFNLAAGSQVNGFNITNCQFDDLYQGASSSSAAPGLPEQRFLYYTRNDALSSIQNVTLDNVHVNGTSQHALLTNAPIANFWIKNSSFQNIWAGSSSGRLIDIQGDITLQNTRFLDLSATKTLYASGTITYLGASPLSLVSVVPASGAGSSATFTATIASTAGAADVASTNLIINDILYSMNACVVTYDAASNLLFLFNDDFTTGYTSGAIGSSGTLQNSQCAINLSASRVTASGNNLILTLPISFKPAFAGAKNIYLRATNRTGSIADYTQMGIWTVAFPPTISTHPLSQSLLAGQTATFTVVADGAPAPSYQWQRNGLNISGATSASYTTPTLTTADNGASYRCIVSNVAGSLISSAAVLSVTAPTALQLVSVTPSSGSGNSATFIATIASSAGAADIASANFIVNDVLYSMNACVVNYDAASNLLFLYNDDFTTGYTSGQVGSSLTLQNSQCALNLSTARADRAGNNLVLTIPLTFKPAFAGAKNTYLRATSKSGAVADYMRMGEWTVPAANSTPVISSLPAATPNPADVAQLITFTVAAADPDGDALSYNWTFGDGASATGPAVTHAYAAAGTYSARILVTDGKGGSAQGSLAIIVNATPNALHVKSIIMSVVKDGGNRRWASAQVSIVDSLGAAVNGATVSAQWSDLVTGPVSSVTNASGVAGFASSRTKQTGTFTLTVSYVSAPGFVYDSSKNVVTRASITTSGVVTALAPSVEPSTTSMLSSPAAPPPGSAAGQAAALSGGMALGSVSVNQSFKLRLPLPAALAPEAKARAVASALPAGVRIRGGALGGRVKQAGEYLFTVRFLEKASGVVTEQNYSISVQE